MHVRKKQKNARIPPASRIPPEILGVPTDVIEARIPRRPTAPRLRPSCLPLAPGLELRTLQRHSRHARRVVRDDAGVRYLLSTAHTLREGGNFKKGDLMVHPGPPIRNIPQGWRAMKRVNLGLDAGIARLEPGIQAVNRALLSNRLILAPEMPQLQDILEKSGRTTHITRGQVRGVGTFGGFFPAMRLVLRRDLQVLSRTPVTPDRRGTTL